MNNRTNELSLSIKRGRDESGIALACFLTAGYPERDTFWSLAELVSREVDVLEIGVPFSDPLADGPTIQESSAASLQQGVSLDWIFAELSNSEIRAPVVLMGYLNPFLQFGIDRLEAVAHGAGVSSFIIPDLPFNASGPLADEFNRVGLELVPMITPLTSDTRMARMASKHAGFVYAVTSTGTTGRTDDSVGDIDAYLRKARATFDYPVMAGFGIRHPEQVAMLTGKADGVIVGSAMIEQLRDGSDPIEFLRSLRTRNQSKVNK